MRGLQVAVTPWSKPGELAHPRGMTLLLDDGSPAVVGVPYSTGQWLFGGPHGNPLPETAEYGHHGLLTIDGMAQHITLAANLDVMVQPSPTTPPPTLPPPTGGGIQIAVTPWAKPGEVATPKGMTLLLDDGHPAVPGVRIDTGQWVFGGDQGYTIPATAAYGHHGLLSIDTYQEHVTLAPNLDITLPPPVVARPGLVRFSGHAWLDDAGLFYPLGDTLLYALGHWHRGGAKRDLVKENAEFCRLHNHDYVRWLGQVDWGEDQNIDPNWPSYQQDAAALIDYLYDVQGLRSKVTVTGGGDNPQLAAQLLRPVLAARPHKILMIEAVNEQNADHPETYAIIDTLRDLGIPTSVGWGNSGLDNIKAMGDHAHTTVDILHTERSKGDPNEPGGPDARQVRQCWDFKEFHRPSEDGEGPGPTSSVATLDDPFKLALRRAANIICGAGAVCLHTGSGVYGKDYESSHGFRYAHLSAQPNADRLMQAVRRADEHLPKGIENWSKFNGGYGGALIVEVPANNVNKVYGCRALPSFVEVIIGCDHPVELRAVQGCDFIVVNPETADIIGEGHLNGGQTMGISGLWGYLLIGSTR